ncbi:MAG: BPSS1780 family membrane protein [Castellaniella sp.]
MNNTPTLQASVLPPSAGWAWILQGYHLFRAQPLAMLFWSTATSFIIQVGSVIPVIGQMALVLLTPLLTFLTLNACRTISRGQKMVPGLWLAPLKAPGVMPALLRLGSAYLGFTLLAAFISVLPFLSSLVQSLGTGSDPDYASLAQAMWGPMLVFGGFYVLLSALFWHAPALMGWHALPLKRALFYSMVACWRTKWAIVLYVGSWAAVYYGLSLLLGTLASAGLTANSMTWISLILDIVLTALLYCSFYPVYATTFRANDTSALQA